MMQKPDYLKMPEYEKLLGCIPYGEENAVSRKTLAAMMKSSDRQVRQMISRLRTCTTILSSSSGGYYRPLESDVEQIDRYIKRERRRAISIFAQVKFAERYKEDLKSGRLAGEAGGPCEE